MPLPDPDTRLRLADDLLVRVDDDRLELLLGGRITRQPLDVLAVLAAIRSGATLRAVLDRLGRDATGPLDWIETSARVAELIDFGAVRANAAATGRDGAPLRDRDIGMHIELLDDGERADAYLQAIAANVAPGDVVVDLGSGTGILALAAARAGARRIYAIEASGFAGLVEASARRNGYGDRIVVLGDWSQRVVVPEPADVLVAEIIGNDPLGEGVLRFMPDAARRFLKPGGRVLPERLRVFATLVAMPHDALLEHCVGRPRLERWQARYGFDFSDLDLRCADRLRRGYRRDDELRRWPVLCPSVELFDLAIAAQWPAEASSRRLLRQVGAADEVALVLHFEITFPGGTRLSTDPWRGVAGSWRSPVIGVRHRAAGAAGACWQIDSTWGALRSTVGIEIERCEESSGAERG
jgi:hypothetical protein